MDGMTDKPLSVASYLSSISLSVQQTLFTLHQKVEAPAAFARLLVARRYLPLRSSPLFRTPSPLPDRPNWPNPPPLGHFAHRQSAYNVGYIIRRWSL